MKTILLLAVLILTSGFSFAQGLEKGNLFGLHMVTVNLKPNTTMDEFKAFFVTRVLPEYEKQWTGLSAYLLNSVRGPHKNGFAIVWLFNTEAARDKYFNADGTPNDLERSAIENVKPIERELEKYGTFTIAYMDDWIVQ